MSVPSTAVAPRVSRWFIPGILTLGYAAYDLGLWISSWRNAHGAFRVAQAAFRGRMLFPTLAAEATAALMASALALVCLLLARRRSAGPGRIVALILVLVASALTAWNLWALM